MGVVWACSPSLAAYMTCVNVADQLTRLAVSIAPSAISCVMSVDFTFTFLSIGAIYVTRYGLSAFRLPGGALRGLLTVGEEIGLQATTFWRTFSSNQRILRSVLYLIARSIRSFSACEPTGAFEQARRYFPALFFGGLIESHSRAYCIALIKILRRKFGNKSLAWTIEKDKGNKS